MEANLNERRRWNDEYWVSVWPKRERHTDSITPYLLDALALRPGERVLDVGSGGGKTTIAAGRRVAPAGVVVGADLSAPLTALATRRAADANVTNVSFRVADMQEDSINGAPFDVAMSQLGVMFFDEPTTAFANIRAQLRPGGRIVFACWQDPARNPWYLAAALGDFLPPQPPAAPGKSTPGAFALADADHTRRVLESAGFTDVQHTPHDFESEMPLDALVDDGQLAFMGIPPDQIAGARAAVDEHFQQFQSESGLYRFPVAFLIFRATAP